MRRDPNEVIHADDGLSCRVCERAASCPACERCSRHCACPRECPACGALGRCACFTCHACGERKLPAAKHQDGIHCTPCGTARANIQPEDDITW